MCGLDVDCDVLKLEIPLCTHCACVTTYVHYPRGRREIARFGVDLLGSERLSIHDTCAVPRGGGGGGGGTHMYRSA